MRRNVILLIGEGQSFIAFIGKALLNGYQILHSRSPDENLLSMVNGDLKLIIVDNISTDLRMDGLLKKAMTNVPPIPMLTTIGLSTDDLFMNGLLDDRNSMYRDSENEDILKRMIESLTKGEEPEELGSENITCQRIRNVTLLEWNCGAIPWIQNESIRKSIRFIQNHYFEPISLHDIADAACLSPYHFCRLFKKCLGISCIKYLACVRIEKAKQLLRDTYQFITEVCFDVGFNDLTHFERVFKNQVGMTPSAYRKVNESTQQEKWKEGQYRPSHLNMREHIFA